MTKTGRILAVNAALIIGLVAQRQYHSWNDRPPSTGKPFANASIFNVSDLTLTPLHNAASAPGKCAMIVIFSTHCAACSYLRYTWPADWRRRVDSARVDIRTEWVSMESKREIPPFFEGYDFQGIETGQMVLTGDRFKRFGFIGTPQSYLVDRFGNLRYSTVGGAFPPVEQLKKACA